MDIPQNAFTIPIQLRFVDTDMAGHVNHATFLSYLETARIEWIEEEGKGTDFVQIPLIIARVEIDYLKPIHLHNKPKVSIWTSRIGTKSFDFDYFVHGEDEDGKKMIYSKAKTVQVYFDYDQQKSVEIPAKERTLLEKYLQ